MNNYSRLYKKGKVTPAPDDINGFLGVIEMKRLSFFEDWKSSQKRLVNQLKTLSCSLIILSKESNRNVWSKFKGFHWLNNAVFNFHTKVKFLCSQQSTRKKRRPSLVAVG